MDLTDWAIGQFRNLTGFSYCSKGWTGYSEQYFD